MLNSSLPSSDSQGKNSAGSKTGEIGHFCSWVPNGISSSQFCSYSLKDDEKKRRRKGCGRMEYGGRGRRGRGKGDLLTTTTTHSKRNSKRTDGMNEGWEKEQDREGRRERKRNERKRRHKRRRGRGKRNTCDALSLTHESSQPPHCHKLMLLLPKSTDEELERAQVLLSQDN